MRPGRRAAYLGAVAVLSVTVVTARFWFGTAHQPTPRERLAAAIGRELPFEARLSGGFQPPASVTTRNTSPAAPPALSPDARIALAEAEKRAEADASLETRSDLGVAYLIQGDVDRAIRTLDDVAAQTESAPVLSDLAAAYLVKAEAIPARRLEYLARALEASGQSLRIAATPEGRFNQLLAVERLAPMIGEPAPWHEYISTEPRGPWTDVARQHASAQAEMADPAREAQERVTRLREALEARDSESLRRIVRESPESATDFFNQELLSVWANSVLQGDTTRTTLTSTTAGALADAIRDVTGDRMQIEEVGLLGTANPALAAAHLDYLNGTKAFANDAYADARRLFQEAHAGFLRANSPYALRAESQIATIEFQQRALAAADSRLAVVEAKARSRSYWTLFGGTLWLRGLVFAKQWRLTEALAALREAAWRFEQMGQHEQAVGVYHQLADTYRTLGEQAKSWEYIGRTLAAVRHARSARRRYLAYYNAALFASSQGLLESALRFQSSAVREAFQIGNEGVVTEALTQRALVHVRRHDAVSARRDVDDASTRLSKVADVGRREYLASELDVLAAELEPATPDNADRLRRAATFFDRFEPGRVPVLLGQLARYYRASGDDGRAVSALEEGISRLTSQQAALGDEALKISYYDDSFALFTDLIALHLSRNELSRAFDTAERSRAHLLRTAMGESHTSAVMSADDIRRSLPPDTALVYYVTEPAQLRIWVLTARAEHHTAVGIRADELARLIAQHRAALVERRVSHASSRLYEMLVAPIETHLAGHRAVAFAPDGDLQQLPFATLRQPNAGRYLVEQYGILLTPSATVLARTQARLSDAFTGRLASALLVGSPNTGERQLDGARQEVRDVSAFYPQAEVWTGREATKERFVAGAREFPLLSRLAFVDGNGGEQSLFAHEISQLRLPHTRLVVLAACSTAGGMVSRGEGVVSVARPFLRAGVPQVVASQWDVDDRSTHQLVVAFHRAFVRIPDAVDALRVAQLSLLRSQDEALADPGSWGAFVALGTLARHPSP